MVRDRGGRPLSGSRRNRRLHNIEAELEQLATNARGSPKRILFTHTAHEIAHFPVDLWPAARWIAALPAPLQARKTQTLPPGLRTPCNAVKRTTPACGEFPRDYAARISVARAISNTSQRRDCNTRSRSNHNRSNRRHSNRSPRGTRNPNARMPAHRSRRPHQKSR